MTDRELDALVAEKMFGFEAIKAEAYVITDGGRIERGDFYYYPKPKPSVKCFPLPAYSTDIAAAWQAVEKMKADGWECGVWTFKGMDQAWFAAKDRPRFSAKMPITVEAESIPRAICLAALKAVGVEVPTNG